ncbi:hypothetical protein PsorP6_017278 [Peronosclerospora sorghi]|uniref:Uncharacterized protein n=1 Tax=Peronosclerospora sorghi TaxID=230839 RepID=A0ACC0WLV8_9STRA|nr:hypothetical protein PsorP6_017278 [Peronosclerospora sorghi]
MVKRTAMRTSPAVSELQPLEGFAFWWSEADEIHRFQALVQNDAPPSAVKRDRLLRVEDQSGCSLTIAASSNAL